MSNPAHYSYIGLAIGPIFSTLQIAESTRELWAASYTFNYLIKEIARRFDGKFQGRNWYKPALNELARSSFRPADQRSESMRATEVGTFPDHLIFSSENEHDVIELQSIAKNVISDFAKTACGELNSVLARELTRRIQHGEAFPEVGLSPYDPKVIEEHLLQYFQIHIIRKSIAIDENPILKITDILSTAEMLQLVPAAHSDFLKRYWAIKSGTILSRDAFGVRDDGYGGKHIETIPEIAIKSLMQRNVGLKRLVDEAITRRQFEEDNIRLTAMVPSDDPDTLMEEVKNYIVQWNADHPEEGLPFLVGHKYVAIVHADGDNVGKLLKSLPNELSVQNAFSAALGAFSITAAQMIQQMGGLPVYLGGDDALFFAPVLYDEWNGEERIRRNIFDFCQQLNERFKEDLQVVVPSGSSVPTLSFGVSITYIKYPLYEALKRSRDLLLKSAKRGIELTDPNVFINVKDRHYIKNNIAFSLLKGSGNLFGAVLHLDPGNEFGLYHEYVSLLNQFQEEDGRALRSIIYDLPCNQVLYYRIASNPQQLTNYLKNSFDEDIHQTESVGEYINHVSLLIHKVYKDWRRYPQLEAYLKPNELDVLCDDNPDDAPEKVWTPEQCVIIPNRICYGLLKTLLFLTAPELLSTQRAAYV